MTADAACKGIRARDEQGSVALVGAESHAPYSRPPLTKGLWQADAKEDSIWRGTADLGVDLFLERRVVEIDVEGHTARDEAGEVYRYERLLLATGGQPRRLPTGNGDVV